MILATVMLAAMVLAAETLPAPGDWASYGAAGLMGALWIWERRLSRSREAQLGETHERLMSDRGLARQMANLIRRNTAALSGLQATQDQLVLLLSTWREEDPPAAEQDKPAA